MTSLALIQSTLVLWEGREGGGDKIKETSEQCKRRARVGGGACFAGRFLCSFRQFIVKSYTRLTLEIVNKNLRLPIASGAES